MGKLQGILLDYLVTNEGSSTIETEQLSINVEKVAAYAFGKKENTLKNCRFKPPSASAFGLGDGKWCILFKMCTRETSDFV